LKVAIDWSRAPAGVSDGSITVASPASPAAHVAVHAIRVDEQGRGFVEDAGVVTIEAEDTSGRRQANGVRWEAIPGFGETLSGMEAFPVTAPASTDPAQQACLDYEFNLLSSGPRTLETVIAPTLPFSPDHGLSFGVAVDGQPQRVVSAWKPYSEAEWSKAVSDGVHKLTTAVGYLPAGNHTLHLCRIDSGVVPERLILFSGQPPAEYLGPEESKRIPR